MFWYGYGFYSFKSAQQMPAQKKNTALYSKKLCATCAYASITLFSTYTFYALWKKKIWNNKKSLSNASSSLLLFNFARNCRNWDCQALGRTFERKVR